MPSSETPVTITVTLPNPQVAMALAQFVKRLGWTGMRECAVSEHETYLIRDGIDQVQRALGDAGYAPR